MTMVLKPGCRVRRRNDNSWSEPGMLMKEDGQTGHVYWPEDDIYEDVALSDLEEYRPTVIAA